MQRIPMKFQGRTATAIIIFPEKQILLIKRLTPPFIGYWALPGGRAEPGEPIEQTAIREVKEETGIKIKIVRKVGEYHEFGEEGGQEYDYYPACFLSEPMEGQVTEQESEVSEIQLFKINEIPKVMAFVHAKMIEDFINQEESTKTASVS